MNLRTLCLGLAAAAWLGALTVVSAGGDVTQTARATKGDIAEFLPPGAGKDLVAKECSSCHTPDGVVRLRATKAGWEAVVLDMVARGAPLMIEDADAIIGYLSTVFGPTAPPLVNVNTASAGDLVKLPGVTPEHAARAIAHRTEKGRFTSRDQFQAAAGLDDATFEKIRWYLDLPKPDSK